MTQLQNQFKLAIQDILDEYDKIIEPEILLGDMIREYIQDIVMPGDDEYKWKEEYLDEFVKGNAIEIQRNIWSWEDDLSNL